MTDTTDLSTDAEPTSSATAQDPASAPARRRAAPGTGLAALVLPELQALAGQLGISGVGRLRKSQLIEAIEARQPREATATVTDPEPSAAAFAPAAEPTAPPARRSRRASAPAGAPAPEAVPDAAVEVPAAVQPGATSNGAPARRSSADPVNGTRRDAPERDHADRDPSGQDSSGQDASGQDGERNEGEGGERMSRADRARERFLEREARRAERAARGEDGDGDEEGGRGEDRPARAPRAAREPQDREPQDREPQDREPQNRASQERDRPRRGAVTRGADDTERQDRTRQDQQDADRNHQDRPRQERDRPDRQVPDRQAADRQGPEQGGPDDDDEFGPGRRGRFRERGRRRGRDRFGAPDGDPVVTEDDVLVPVGGILDVLENYGFVRTTGYLTGPSDVYVSMQQMKRYGLRRGDAVTGAVRQQREGERRDKFNALVRLDTVNGMDPEEARKRPEFGKLTPLYPQDRLRLETDAQTMTTRVIDLVMPVGKGQRALIVSPPKAGKTMVLQAIANAITTNNPECHLMVVLVDERPEEVTDMQRSVKGEVIASTFDRPPQDHITIAELSIERAKRLVELGHDVVVLLDSITRLGRAYNLGAPASGRVLTGGVDSAALYPPKRFLGAARNIENGGSLTIFATALVETGSAMDTVIFEEFKGTGNAELKLDRRLADRRMFPAIDVDASGTRKEELLLAPEELRIVHQLRRVLHALDSGARLELLLDKMKSTRTNVEFLMQIQKTTVSQDLAKG